MRGEVSKSDWKQFKSVRELALERLCKKNLEDVSRISQDDKKTWHERYLGVGEGTRVINKPFADHYGIFGVSQTYSIQLPQTLDS